MLLTTIAMLLYYYYAIDNNTIQLSFDITLVTLKFGSALTRLGGADAVVLQSNCVRRTCSKSLHSNCLGRGSNTCSPCYRSSALTNEPVCHTLWNEHFERELVQNHEAEWFIHLRLDFRLRRHHT